MKLAAGWIFPLLIVGLLLMLLIEPKFLFESESGPGSVHAALGVSIAVGAGVGFLAQRTRMYFVGGWRDIFLTRDFYLISGIVAFFVGAIITNAILGNITWGFDDHPLRVMIVGDKGYAEARGLSGWYRRGKSNAWQMEVEELWEVEEGTSEMSESFPRMADGVIKAMIADEPFPADGEAAWNELLFEAAVHRSAMNDGARVMLADIEKDAMG